MTRQCISKCKFNEKLRNLFAQKAKNTKKSHFFSFFSSLRKKIAHCPHYLCSDKSLGGESRYLPGTALAVEPMMVPPHINDLSF